MRADGESPRTTVTCIDLTDAARTTFRPNSAPSHTQEDVAAPATTPQGPPDEMPPRPAPFAGVAATVKQIKGTIGYVEYAYAKQNGLVTTKIDGNEPSAEAFKSGKWILTAETFLIVYPDSENTKNVAEFVKFCYNNDAMADALDYVPLSAEKKAATLELLSK